MVQTAEKNVVSVERSTVVQAPVCIRCDVASSLPIIVALSAFLLAAAVGVWQQWPTWQIVLSSLVVGFIAGFSLRWAKSSQLALTEDALVITSNVHRHFVPREAICDSTWSRKKTFRNGMLSGNQYTLDVAYKTKSGRQRTMNFRWWIVNGKPHLSSQHLLSELNSKFTDDCSFAIRSSKRC